MKVRHAFTRWFVAAFAVFFLGGHAGSAGAVTLAPFSVIVAPGNALPGGSVDFTLTRTGTQAFDTLDLTFDFDATVLALSTLTPIQPGSVLGGFGLPAFNPSAGLAGNRVTAFLTSSSLDLTSATGDILVARFTVLSGATLGNTVVNFQSPSSSLSDPTTLVVPLTSGTLIVGAVPEPGQWMTLLSGLALLGTVLARRRRV